MTRMVTLYKQRDTVYSCCSPLLWSVSDNWYIALVTVNIAVGRGRQRLPLPTAIMTDVPMRHCLPMLQRSDSDNWYIAVATGEETLPIPAVA